MPPPTFGSRASELSAYDGTLQKSQDELWNNLAQFYSENEETIERCMRLDMKAMAKSESASEIESQIDSYVETARIVLDGLVALGNLHPVLGVAVFAFHAVISLDLSRRDNDRKVLAIQLQMQNMMCAMFQLRHLKHAHVQGPEKEQERARLERLVKTIADEITQCGSDLNYYMNRKLVSKLINAKTYTSRFQGHVENFALRRSELQVTITAYIAAGMDAANTAITDVAVKIDQIDQKLDGVVHALFRALESSREGEGRRFIEKNGGVETCISKDELLTRLLSTAGDILPPTNSSGKVKEDRLQKSREALNIELKQNLDDIFKQNLSRFEKILTVQNNNFKRLSDQIERQGQYLREDSTKLDKLHSTSLLILEEGKLIMKAIGPNFAVKLNDPELQQIWDYMGLKHKRSVKAKHFVLTLRDHLADPSNSYGRENAGRLPEQPSPVGETNPDPWFLQYIDVAHVQPIVEAIDEDGSGFISVAEANKFALSRPQDWSLLQWMVYWAAGWHINITYYRRKIYAILLEMHEMLPSIHPANCVYVNEYLDSYVMTEVEALLRSTKAVSDDAWSDTKLNELAESFAALQETVLATNLNEVSFVISSAADVTLIAGSSRVGSTRIESWIYPVLYLLLDRHLDIMRLAKVHTLNFAELFTHSMSLYWLFSVFTDRMHSLEARFGQLYRDSTIQFENFAYGMFLTLHQGEAAMTPVKNTVVTFRDTASSENKISESISKHTETSGPASTPSNILAKPQDPSFEFESDTDFSSHVSEQSVEGYWSGVCWILWNDDFPYQGLHHGVITLSGDGKFTGSGNTFCGPVKFDGTISETGTLKNVDFKILTEAPELQNIWCRGQYDPNTDAMRGQWVVENASGFLNDEDWEKDTKTFHGNFHFTRTPATLFRFRSLLDNPGPDSSWSLSRRQWAFAMEATKYQVQARVGSWQFFCARIVEKNTWIELANRVLLDFDKVAALTRGHITDQNRAKFGDLTYQIHPTRGRLYNELATYLYSRRYFDKSGQCHCDYCGQRITFQRYQCIMCMKEDLSNQIDLCVDDPRCIEAKVLLASEQDFVHQSSHTLLKSTLHVHRCELPFMITQSRIRSERIKKSFRASGARQKPVKEDVMTPKVIGINKPAETEEMPQTQLLTCVCCDKEVSLPCWVCATCALDTIICLDCELHSRPVKIRLNNSSTHSHKHPLLLIRDSIEVILQGITGNNILEQELKEIRSELRVFEQNISAQLKEVAEVKRLLRTSHSSLQEQGPLDTGSNDADQRSRKQAVEKRHDKFQAGSAIFESTNMEDLTDNSVPEEGTAYGSSDFMGIDGKFPNEASLTERIAALESKIDEKMSNLEAKVDNQFALMHSLLQQLVYTTSSHANQSGDSTI